MKTKMFLALAAIALAPLTSGAAPKAAKAETYKVSPADSKITWEGRKKIGDSHHGELSVKSGQLKVAGEKLVGGEFEIDMNSLKVTDVKDAGMNKKLTGHLRSDDFFSIDKHPTSKLVITKVEEKDGKTMITGDLTIKGKKESITFPSTVSVTKEEVKAQSTLNVDRTKYDVRYNSGKFFPNLGDKVINDEFTVNVDLTAKK